MKYAILVFTDNHDKKLIKSADSQAYRDVSTEMHAPKKSDTCVHKCAEVMTP